MEKSSSYYLELQENRFKQQKDELEEVISLIRRGGEGGGEKERERLEIDFKKYERELEGVKESNRRLNEENEQLKQKPSTQKPLKRPAIDPDQVTQAGQEAEKFKSLYRECLMKDIPPGMTLSKARIITVYIDSLTTSSPSGNRIATRQKVLKSIELKYKTILRNLELLDQHIEKEKQNDDNEDNLKTRKEELLTMLYDEINQEAQRMRSNPGGAALIEQTILPQIKKLLESMQSQSTLVKERKRPPSVEIFDLKCRVCGYVGGRLSREETPPHRLFCGESCQSKFYFINKSK